MSEKLEVTEYNADEIRDAFSKAYLEAMESCYRSVRLLGDKIVEVLSGVYDIYEDDPFSEPEGNYVMTFLVDREIATKEEIEEIADAILVLLTNIYSNSYVSSVVTEEIYDEDEDDEFEVSGNG